MKNSIRRRRRRHWRRTREYRRWVKDCRKRDGNKCVITGATGRLHVHHLDHATYFPNKKFDVNNGVTVHRLVHTLFHIFMMGGYRKKCTRKDWKRFTRLFKYINMISKLIYRKQKTKKS